MGLRPPPSQPRPTTPRPRTGRRPSALPVERGERSMGVGFGGGDWRGLAELEKPCWGRRIRDRGRGDRAPLFVVEDGASRAGAFTPQRLDALKARILAGLKGRERLSRRRPAATGLPVVIELLTGERH